MGLWILDAETGDFVTEEHNPGYGDVAAILEEEEEDPPM